MASVSDGSYSYGTSQRAAHTRALLSSRLSSHAQSVKTFSNTADYVSALVVGLAKLSQLRTSLNGPAASWQTALAGMYRLG